MARARIATFLHTSVSTAPVSPGVGKFVWSHRLALEGSLGRRPKSSICQAGRDDRRPFYGGGTQLHLTERYRPAPSLGVLDTTPMLDLVTLSSRRQWRLRLCFRSACTQTPRPRADKCVRSTCSIRLMSQSRWWPQTMLLHSARGARTDHLDRSGLRRNVVRFTREFEGQNQGRLGSWEEACRFAPQAADAMSPLLAAA